MGKTADLTVVQKTIIDTLHKERKPQTFMVNKLFTECCIKHVNRKLSGRKRCTTQTRENRSRMRIVKHPIQEFGELHKEWTEGWGQGIESTTHRRVRGIWLQFVIRGVLPGLREEELDCCPVVQSPLFR